MHKLVKHDTTNYLTQLQENKYLITVSCNPFFAEKARSRCKYLKKALNFFLEILIKIPRFLQNLL